MAKKKSVPIGHPDRHWEVHDAMQTMKRAGEIVGDKKLMAEVKKMAMTHADEMKQVAHHAGRLAKMGRISPRAMSKLAQT
jgi:hypothetical protein